MRSTATPESAAHFQARVIADVRREHTMEGVGIRPFVYLIPLLLGAYYVIVTDASSRSKTAVGTILLVSFLAMFAVPAYWLLAMLTQVAVGLYIAFYLAFKRR